MRELLFFDYLLIHGSGSNMSPNDQKRIILLLLDNKIKITQYEKNISLLHVSDRRTLEKDILKKEFIESMILSGCKNLQEITRDLVVSR